MPTLQDVAKRAGVSAATVSKVLSNTPYFSDATRDKVLEAVDAIGYRPNLAARALSSGKTNIIAVVFPYVYDTIFKDPLVMRVLEGIEAVCTEQDFNILLSTPRLNQNEPDEHYMRLIQSGYIEGLIAIDNVQAVSFANVAQKMNIPSVVLGQHDGDYSVRSDNFLGGQLMMAHVLDCGHQKIGLISVDPKLNMAIQKRVEGMLQVYQAHDLPYDIPIVESDFSSEGGAKAVQELISDNPTLTTVICVNDRMAIGALSALKQMGIKVTQDISVVGYDDIPLAGTTQPALTTINQKPVELGRAAAELMLKRLNGEKPTNVVISPTLIKRESLAIRR